MSKIDRDRLIKLAQKEMDESTGGFIVSRQVIALARVMQDELMDLQRQIDDLKEKLNKRPTLLEYSNK